MVELPSELKSLSSVVARANELEVVEPAVAYWSRYWIVQKSMELQKTQRSSKVEAYLLHVLDNLEAMKTKHADIADLESFASGKVKVETFALQIFDNADREEKARKATLNTSLKFLAAATFLEVCQVFGQPEKDLVDRRKYAKVQAMRIQSAIAAGKDPNTRKSALSEQGIDAVPTAAEAAELDALLPRPPSSSQHQAVEALQEPSPQADEVTVSRPPIDLKNAKSSDGNNSTSYFPTEHDTADLSSHVYDRIPVEYKDALEHREHGVTQNTNSEEQNVLASLPAQAPVAPVDSDAIASAQKHAKWAISALNYEDIATATSELKKALNCLATTV